MPDNEIRLINYLPAIFRETPFLEMFLRPFEQALQNFHDRTGNISTCFDPFTTDADFLPWLASWVALVLDDEWPEEKKRLLISRTMDLYRGRGTVDSLKEYLEIYTGTDRNAITIRECVWPAGMQIGVASMIGGFTPSDVRFRDISAERAPLATYDYYLVREVDPDDGSVRQYYYRTDMVWKVNVDVQAKTVVIYYVRPDPDASTVHTNATVTRRDGLADTHYMLTGTPVGGGDTISADYWGDTVLISEEGETPYRFIVDVIVNPDRFRDVRVEKIQAILDLEKPAHTVYYLRLIQARPVRQIEPMQIAEYSSIGVDNYIGERN